MKKAFLASTAIVGILSLGTPAEAAQPVSVTLGGFMAIQAGLWDNDQPSQMGYELRNDTELYIDTSAEADNGLKYGVQIQIEYVSNNNDDGRRLRTDEANIYLTGGFGTIEIGDQDGASETLAVYAPISGVGSDLLDGDYSNFPFSTSSLAFGAGDTGRLFKVVDTDDSTKVTYYTPSLMGLTVGASYAPQINEGDAVVQWVRETTTTVAGTTTTTTTTNISARDIFELGAQYKREFNGVGISAGVTASNYTSVAAGAKDENYWGWQLGGQISYLGFTVGGGYLDQDGPGAANQYDSWNIGASYTVGPVLLGVAYQSGEDDLKRGFESFGGGITYTVADGLGVYGEVIHYNDETTLDEGTVAVLGTTVSF